MRISELIIIYVFIVNYDCLLFIIQAIFIDNLSNIIFELFLRSRFVFNIQIIACCVLKLQISIGYILTRKYAHEILVHTQIE